MNGTTLFDDYVQKKSLGLRAIDSQLPEMVADEYGRYLDRVRLFVDSAKATILQLPSVYADFVLHPAFNAQAVFVSDMYLIVIFDGMPVVTTAVVRRMLSDQRLFRHIGNASLETDTLPLYSQFTPNASSLSQTIKSLLPMDDDRLSYCNHLQNTVFDFIAAHELTHIAHGHLRYQSAEHGKPMIDELDWMSGSPEGNLESQTMEMDADFNAAKLMMQSIDRLWKVHATLQHPMNLYYDDRSKAVYDVAAAICIICRMFGDNSISGVDLSKSRHPPMRWRQMWTLNTLGNYVEHLWGDLMVPSCVAAITNAVSDVEEAFEVITGCRQSVVGLHDVWGPAGQAYAKRLGDCWNSTLKAKLRPHAYIDEMPFHGFDFTPPKSPL